MAIKTQGTIVYMQTALAGAKTISGASLGSPGAGAVTVTATSHGYSADNIIKITGVSGMQQINNRAFVVAAAPGTNTFVLKGTNGASYTAYSSGGSAYVATMTAIGEVTSISEMGGTDPQEIDVSHLQSLSASKLAGNPTQSNISFNVWFDLTASLHNDLVIANQDLADRVFWFYKPASFHMTVLAQVGGVKVTAGDVNSAYSATVTLIPRAAGSWALTT